MKFQIQWSYMMTFKDQWFDLKVIDVDSPDDATEEAVRIMSEKLQTSEIMVFMPGCFKTRVIRICDE